jgi:hypothetical protein
MLRSISWPEDEKLAIPYRSVQNWKDVRHERGLLTLDALAEMAALNRDSMPMLLLWFPEARYLEAAQTPLRWYLRASSQMRGRLMSEIGVPLSELGLSIRTAVQEQDPASEQQIAWTSIVQALPPDALRLSFRYGKSEDGGKTQLGVAAILQGPQPNAQQLLIIPLFPAP